MTTPTASSPGVWRASATGSGFHADTVEDLRAAFHEAVEDYIETCAKLGKDPQRAYSGQMMFRVSPEVHAAGGEGGGTGGEESEPVGGRGAGEGGGVKGHELRPSRSLAEFN